MKRIAMLLLFAVCLAAFAYAQDSGGAEEMTGTIACLRFFETLWPQPTENTGAELCF